MKTNFLAFLLTVLVCIVAFITVYNLSFYGVLNKSLIALLLISVLSLIYSAFQLTKKYQAVRSQNEGLTQEIQTRTREAEKLALVASKTENAVILVDKNDVIEWVNDGFTRITGYSSEESIGKAVYFLRGQNTSPQTAARILEKLKLKKPFTEEILNYKKDGSPIWLSLNITPILDQFGNMTGSIAIQSDITERKKTEDELKTSQANLSALIENASDSIWSIDQHLNIITFNSYCYKEFLNSMGITLRKGMNIDEFMPLDKYAESNAYWRAQYQRALEGEYFSIEKAYGENDKREIYLESFYPIMEEGKITGVSVFSKEITKIKKVSEELEKTVSLLLATFESSADGILAVDKSGKIVSYNNKFAELWNIPEHVLKRKDDEEAIAHVISQVKSPIDFIAKIQYLYANPAEESYDVIEFKDGKYFERYSLPQKLNKEIIGRVWSFRDITKKIQTANQLKKAAEEIYDLYNNAPCGYHSILADGTFAEMNDTELSWLGYGREEIVGKKKIFDLMPNVNKETLMKRFSEFIELGIATNTEYELQRKDGTILPALINSTAVKDKNGKFLRSRTTVLNIEERKKIETELLHANKIAEESLKYREQFLADISHEIRTPLSGISGVINLLMGTRLSKEQREYVVAMNTSSENMLVLLNDILDLSKIDSGKMNFEEAEFNLSDDLHQTVSILKPRAELKKIHLSLEILPGIPALLVGDATRLNQVLLNLLSNSIKFTEKGSVKIQVRKKNQTDQNIILEFIVSDSGIGIEQDKLDTIFETYTQGGIETARKYGGTGLGLAIAKKITELQGGTITLQSQIGKGSVFTVMLPFKWVTGSSSLNNGGEKHFQSEERKNKICGTVLLAEDNPVNQLLIKKLLSRWGILVDIAENGKSCIEKLKEKKYDLILMDVLMPEMNGYEATSHIRNNLQSPENEIPVIAMTAYATSEEKEKCFEAGMNDYLSKPFNTKELFAKLSTYLPKKLAPEGNTEKKQPSVLSRPTGSHSNPGRITNLSYLEELAAGSSDFIEDMIQVFIQQTPDSILELEEFCREQKWEELKTLAHRMKPSISFVGIKKLNKIMEQLELYAEQEKNLEKIPGYIATIRKVCGDAIVELTEELKKLRN